MAAKSELMAAVVPKSGKAGMRAALKQAGSKRLGARGAETWVEPRSSRLHTLAAAVELERERRREPSETRGTLRFT